MRGFNPATAGFVRGFAAGAAVALVLTAGGGGMTPALTRVLKKSGIADLNAAEPRYLVLPSRSNHEM